MTTPEGQGPQDPFAAPQPGATPDPNQPPPYGQPPPPPPPGYGAPPPQYGAPPPGYAQAPYGQPGYGGPPMSTGTNGFAIASLICAFLCSPLGLIFGFVAKSQIKQRGQGGDGLATAGIILSAIFLVLGIALAASGNTTFTFNGS